MLKFENVRFDYEPYPVGLARGAFAPDVYRELVEDNHPLAETAETSKKYARMAGLGAWASSTSGPCTTTRACGRPSR